MKEIWVMTMSYSTKGSSVNLEAMNILACPIIKTTEKQYHIQDGGGAFRVTKSRLDTKPGYYGTNGKYFSSRELALKIWLEEYRNKARKAKQIIEHLLVLQKGGKKK